MGTKHPQRSKISHPFCAVPSSSNVCEGANAPVQAPKEKCQSHLQDNTDLDSQENEASCQWTYYLSFELKLFSQLPLCEVPNLLSCGDKKK
jgi:hypothetical protein